MHTRLRQFRDMKGFRSAEKFADFLKINHQTYAHYETGHSKIPVTLLEKLHSIGCDLNWLISGIDKKVSDNDNQVCQECKRWELKWKEEREQAIAWKSKFEIKESDYEKILNLIVCKENDRSIKHRQKPTATRNIQASDNDSGSVQQRSDDCEHAVEAARGPG